MPDNYKEFHEWHKQQLHITDWNFIEELITCCLAEIELLSKAVLSFRKSYTLQNEILTRSDIQH